MRLSSRLLLLISVTFATIISAVGWVAFRAAQEQIKATLADQTMLFARGMVRELDRQIADLQRNQESLARSIVGDYYRHPERLRLTVGDRLFYSTHFPLGVFLFDHHGRLLDQFATDPRRSEEGALREFVRRSIAQPTRAVSAPYFSDLPGALRIPRLAFSTPLHGLHGELIGIFVGITNPFDEGFLAELLDFRLGKSGYAYLVTQQRLMVVHPDAQEVMKTVPPAGTAFTLGSMGEGSVLTGEPPRSLSEANDLLDRAVEGFEGTGEAVNSRGQPALVAFAHMTTTGWILGVNYLQEEAYAPLTPVQRAIALATLAALLLFLSLAWYATRSLIQPLRSAVDEIERLTEHPDALVPIREEGGSEVRSLAHAFNKLIQRIDDEISQRDQAEQQLQWSEQRLHEVTNSLGDAIFVRDMEGVITFVNPQACTLLGYTEAEMLGSNSHDLFHHRYADGRHYPKAECAINVLANSGQRHHHEDTYWCKDGTAIPVSMIISPLKRGDRQIGSVLSFRDMTERKRIMRELIEARDAARSSERARSEFLANMSHEIRTPMNGVLGMTELLLGSELTPQQTEYVEMIQFSGEYLLTIINEILDYSKIEANRLELDSVEFSPHKSISELISPLVYRAKQKGLTVRLHIDRQVPRRLIGDPARLGQVLVNLVGNAIKFTGIGGIVVTVTEEGKHDEQSCHLRISVSDTGIGIAADQVERIFAPFEQADGSISRQYGGTGLGLAISRQLVERMGGRIWVESIPNKGSTFHFTVALRRVVGSSGAQGGTGSNGGHPTGKPLRVLLAEDNPVNQTFASTILRQAGHAVTVAANGSEAVQLAIAQTFDVILMDVQMPVVDGFAATAQLRAQGVTVPIIALTAHAMTGFRDECLAKGMDDYLSKPIHAADLVAALARLAGHEALHGAAAQVPGTPAVAESSPTANSRAAETIALKAFNRDTALAMAGGDATLIDTMLAMVLEQIENDLPTLAPLVAGTDAVPLKDAAHRMKGSLAAIGAEQAHAACVHLENSAKAGNMAAWAPALADLELRCNELVAAVRDRLGDKGEGD